MTEISTSPSTSSRWRPPSLFNLAAIALLLALAGLGAAYLLLAMANNRPETKLSTWSKPLVQKNIAATELTIPASWISASDNGNSASGDQLDLEVNLQFAPGAKPHPVKLRLIASSKAQPSSYLLDTVYLRQFSPLQENGVSGLIGKPLNPKEGFENETVWYDPISTRPFVAKCLGANINSPEASCLRTVQLTSQLAIIYRFDVDLLAYWKNFDATMLPILTQIGVFSN
ncbi:hypothetical protein MNBD_ALPHA12-457 [hydrothermal vent metagenome]|uniref:Uncharacterized protein n=1 Tax=hydrothermal vent metagenome TaxID=652676 RepID=A0A3B0TFF1_9ZZZZ